MSLEEEIKQTRPFISQKEKAIVNIMFTNNWVKDKLKLLLVPYGVTEKQYNILRILNGHQKPMTTSEIRSRMIDKMSDITRLIERLIKKGLVSKSVNIGDKRLVDISITQQGQTVLADFSKQKGELVDILKNLSQEESELLNKLLDKIRTT